MVEYVAALCRDLKKHAPECRDYMVDTIFLGGGTPTMNLFCDRAV